MFIHLTTGDIVELVDVPYAISTYIRLLEIRRSIPALKIAVRINDGSMRMVRMESFDPDVYLTVQANDWKKK